MDKQYVDLDTLKFLLYDVHDLESVLKEERFQEHDLESSEMYINSVKDFADREMYPCFREMDEQPAHYKDGNVVVHPQVKTMMSQGGEMGFISASFDHEAGGFQLPLMVQSASTFIQDAANNHLSGYTQLTQGAAELIIHFGNQELNETYVPRMVSGEWGGTMCLTEPQAGSSLSDLVTSATPTDEGHYLIKGQKIFISGGDYIYAGNIVHLLLARVKGAPSGTKGISLFVVPKKRPTADGLVPNDVITASDFPKMGQRGYCTTHLIFGENDDCRAWLVGEENKGLKYMFRMMNGARIAVGRGGAAIATAAYHASLAYAKERPQGRRISNSGEKKASDEPTLIINHPDVRRMLLLQKCVSEGSLSLVMAASRCADLLLASADEETRQRAHLLLELLTPVVKTYPAEMGAASVSNGLQVLGGYGFCSEYILQQYHRDIRIFSIYEGTTGIQSQDLLGRKVFLQGGKALQLLAGEVMGAIQRASTYEDLKPYGQQLGGRLQLVQKVLEHLGAYAQKGMHERFISDASLFMEMFSTVVIAWQWLEMATHAKTALVTGNGRFSMDFYHAKVHAMRFYFKYELAKTTGLAEALMNPETLTIPTEEEIFV